jgi:hypothetical protein
VRKAQLASLMAPGLLLMARLVVLATSGSLVGERLAL